MWQAIEEGFILDVLENDTTYKAYWRLLEKIEDDPHHDKPKAESLFKVLVVANAFADTDLDTVYVFARYP